MVKWWCDVSRSNVTLSKIQPMSCDYGILCQYVMNLLQYLSTNRVRTGDRTLAERFRLLQLGDTKCVMCRKLRWSDVFYAAVVRRTFENCD